MKYSGRERFLSFAKASQTISGAHPVSYNRHRCSFSEVNQAVREVDHSLLSNAELSMSGAIPLRLIYVSGMDWDNLTFS